MNHKTERDEALAKWQRECEDGSVPVTPMMRHAYRDGWDDALAGQSAGVAEGWKLVPIEPTVEMLEAGARHIPALHVWTGMIAAAPAPVVQSAGVAEASVELSGVKEAIENGGGFWRSCWGCYETNEGAETGHYPYSKIMQCCLGSGCSECGGIGAVWDDTDYAAMGDAMMASTNSAAPAPVSEPADMPEGWRELCRRLYVELFHCEQQMRSTLDQDGEPHWTQSAVVRVVLKDAKAALAAAPAPVSAAAPDREQATLCEDGGKCGIGGYCGQCEKVRAASDPEQPSEPDYTDCCDTPSLCSSVRRCTAQDAPRARGAACPHGVDDGACKQCYGEATSGEQGEAKGVCQRCGGTGVVDDGEITGAGVEFENGPVKCVKDCQDCADSAPAKAEAKCKACGGNDGDMPCAYPEGRADCLRNASASTLDDGVIPADCDVRKLLLRVVPGDGDDYEVYAKNISDVENLLCELEQRLEDFELARAQQPQAAEPKGMTDEQRDAWMENAGYKVHSKYSHIGTAWDFTFPGKTGMDNRHYRSEGAARDAAIAHFEEAVRRARALLAKGE